MQIVVKLLLDEVANELLHAHAARVGRNGSRAELYLSLALEHRLLYVYCHRSHNTVADVTILEILRREEVVYRKRDKLLEGTLMRTALRGVLSVDK